MLGHGLLRASPLRRHPHPRGAHRRGPPRSGDQANVAQPEDPNAPPQDDKAQPKAKKQDKQPTPQPISAFGATQQVKADSQGVFTFVCPLPGWWAFSTSMAGDPLQDPEGKQKPLEIKTNFLGLHERLPQTAPSKK